jgi:hypothetical protein
VFGGVLEPERLAGGRPQRQQCAREPIVLDASGSAADSCPGGFLYRFWHDRDDNGVLGDPLDLVLRQWTADPILAVAPYYTRRYAVEVKCSSPGAVE